MLPTLSARHRKSFVESKQLGVMPVLAGGTLVMPKTSIGPNGFMAFFIDTEGNCVAMHSNK